VPLILEVSLQLLVGPHTLSSTTTCMSKREFRILVSLYMQGVAPRGQSGPEYDEHPHIMQLYAGRCMWCSRRGAYKWHFQKLHSYSSLLPAMYWAQCMPPDCPLLS
jgi:hypothetical protein